MIAVYSLWEDNRKKTNGGFRSKKELATCLTLSVLESKKQFKSVEFWTNDYGAELVERYKIPFNKVHVQLNHFNDNLNPDFWAYIKLWTYAQQTEPFVHIDNDVILWQKIPEEVNSKKMFFQNIESLETHKGYLTTTRLAYDCPKLDKNLLDENPKFALNCGIVGCNDLSLISEWKEKVDEYLFSLENTEYWNTIKDKHSHNHLFEQYFISSLISSKGLYNEVYTLLGENFFYDAKHKFKMTHLWGEAKREGDTMAKVARRLYNDYPEVKQNIEIELTHSEIFDDIYKNELWGEGQGSGGGSSPQITVGYRKFLQKFLKDYNIKSVIDLGCGDWQFSKLIDWSGIEYLGLDCVKTIIKDNKKKFEDNNIKFEFSEAHSKIEETADLLIIKDVMIHWSNSEILNFYNELKKTNSFKYILITNQTSNQNINEDIVTGQFHNIDINRAPFDFNAKEIYKWENDNKITYLLENGV